MKFKLLAATLLLGSLAVLTALRPETPFEGKISFHIEYTQLPVEVQGMEGMLPSEMHMFYKGNWTRIEQSVMGGSQIIVVNSVDSSGFLLMDMMGQRIHVPMTRKDFRETASGMGKPKVTNTGKKATIAGYACREVIVEQDGKKQRLWVTEALNAKHGDYDYLKGFPLKYETSEEGMQMVMEATKVSKQTLSQSLFEVPDGFTTMSIEELEKMGQ